MTQVERRIRLADVGRSNNDLAVMRTDNRNFANMAAARAVLTGANDFLTSHPLNIVLFGDYLTSKHNTDKIRTHLSVPLFDESVVEIFAPVDFAGSGLRKAVKGIQARQIRRRIYADVKAARANQPHNNHRAAVAVVKLLPRAALSDKSQILLIALARFLGSGEGARFNAAVGELAAFQKVLEEYEDLEYERERNAIAKIAQAHRLTRQRTSLMTETVIDLGTGALPVPPTQELPRRLLSHEWEVPGVDEIGPHQPDDVSSPVSGLLTIHNYNRDELIRADDLVPRWALPERPKPRSRDGAATKARRRNPDPGGLER